MAAPPSSSRDIAATWPLSAANKSAVRPIILVWLTDAPPSTSLDTTATRPALAAIIRAVTPLGASSEQMHRWTPRPPEAWILPPRCLDWRAATAAAAAVYFLPPQPLGFLIAHSSGLRWGKLGGPRWRLAGGSIKISGAGLLAGAAAKLGALAADPPPPASTASSGSTSDRAGAARRGAALGGAGRGRRLWSPPAAWRGGPGILQTNACC